MKERIKSDSQSFDVENKIWVDWQCVKSFMNFMQI